MFFKMLQHGNDDDKRNVKTDAVCFKAVNE